SAGAGAAERCYVTLPSDCHGEASGSPDSPPVRPKRRFSMKRPTSRKLTLELLEDRCLLSAALALDINTQGTLPSNPTDLVAVGTTLFFTADVPGLGRELWRSDGTEAGTALVKDIVPGAAGSNPAGLTNVNGVLFFTAEAPGLRFELWRSDGTEAGT